MHSLKVDVLDLTHFLSRFENRTRYHQILDCNSGAIKNGDLGLEVIEKKVWCGKYGGEMDCGEFYQEGEMDCGEFYQAGEMDCGKLYHASGF